MALITGSVTSRKLGLGDQLLLQLGQFGRQVDRVAIWVYQPLCCLGQLGNLALVYC